MAAGKAAEAHQDPARSAVAVHGVPHIDRTSGMKAASGRQKRRNEAFIAVQKGQQKHPDHRGNAPQRSKMRSTSAARSAGVAVKLARRRFQTIRHSGARRESWRRMISRRRRRIRFLFTALPRARGVVKPTFGPSRPGAAQQKATKWRVGIRKPWSYTCRNSDGCSSRRLLGNPSP